jgi:hypothetical protein
VDQSIGLASIVVCDYDEAIRFYVGTLDGSRCFATYMAIGRIYSNLPRSAGTRTEQATAEPASRNMEWEVKNDMQRSRSLESRAS